MSALEKRIPPPAIGILIAIAMWGLLTTDSPWPSSPTARFVVAIVLALVGAAFDAAGLIAFRRARTTINPLKPEAATALVTTGVYRITRNPMYVGMTFLLLAWAAYLGSGWALLGPLAFVLYITRFQIIPEERALTAMFGAHFTDYCGRVRRWL